LKNRFDSLHFQGCLHTPAAWAIAAAAFSESFNDRLNKP
jgi:hypothetical protein